MLGRTCETGWYGKVLVEFATQVLKGFHVFYSRHVLRYLTFLKFDVFI